jgi:hypothetical protein
MNSEAAARQALIAVRERVSNDGVDVSEYGADNPRPANDGRSLYA